MPAVFFSSRSPGARMPGAGARCIRPAAARPPSRRPAAIWALTSHPVAVRRLRLGCPAAAGPALLALLTAAASPAAPLASRATSARAPAIFPGAGFNGVSSASAADAWAVGAISGQTQHLVQALVARWNGTGWARVPIRGLGPRTDAGLNGVSVVSAADAWAVGDSGTAPGLSSLVVRWNGTGWARVPSPSPGAPASGTALSGVSAVSASSAWAVGSYGNVEKTLVLRWNGIRWAQVPSPNPGGAQGSMLFGVASGPGPGAWAVGCYGASPDSAAEHALALRWNGARWTRVPAPAVGASSCLHAVTVVSPSDAWAVGWTAGEVNGPSRALVLRWNGSRWTRVASPAPPGPGAGLNGVSAISAASAWAVGSAGGGQASTTFILCWNGARWVRVASPSQGSSVLDGVGDVSARDALAVGGGGTGALALRWTGSRWVVS
jgi:hypothetical protein